jgi:hypothetical protein
MRRQFGIMALALILSAAARPGAAQQGPSGPAAAGFTQLFISPCGEPYRGRPGEPYPVVLWFRQADLNHDGVVDKAEFRADHAGFFDSLDADGDGYLDGPEVAFYEHRVVPDILGPELGQLDTPSGLARRGGARLILAQISGLGQSPEGSHPGDRPGYQDQGPRGPAGDLGATRPRQRELLGAAAYGLLAEAEPVRAADTNLDGRVSKAEFLAAADRRFKRLDKRGDGKLTLDELPMTASQAQAARRR